MCSAGIPTSVDVESHVQIWSTLFCLYCKQWWPPGWTASFSSPGKENWSALVSCKAVLSFETNSLGQLLKPTCPTFSWHCCADVCMWWDCGDTALLHAGTERLTISMQQSSISTWQHIRICSKDVMHMTCFHPQRKETKEKKHLEPQR